MARTTTEWETELHERQTELSKELDVARHEFDKRTQSIREELARVEGMLRALTGQVTAKYGAKRPRREGGGEGFTNEEVIPLIQGFLQEAGPLTEKEIFMKAKAKAKEIGKNGQGLHFRVKGALKDSRFTPKENKWILSQ